MYQFKRAVGVWGEALINKYNQFLGFYAETEVEKEQEIVIAVAARSYYRLYIDGKMAASGPARTAKNYCRVDEIRVKVSGRIKIAAEVTALDKPEKYCNDCTLEPGLFTAEVTDEGGNVLTATGDGVWRYKELFCRRPLVETMSHSRGIMEVYDLNEKSFEWRLGIDNEMKIPAVSGYPPVYLERRSPYATYKEIPMGPLIQAGDIVYDENESAGFVHELARLFNPEWYGMIPEEECFLNKIRKEKDSVFSGKLTQYRDRESGKRMVCVQPGGRPVSLMWSIPRSELGFIDFTIKAGASCTVDIINSDHMHVSGVLKANSYVTRYHLQEGEYHLTTFEPKLTKYLKIILRTEGRTELSVPQLLEDTYPDDDSCFFECSDGDLNMIYEAAKRTLRLNTLDIFMDCPQRERGGWLCDSQFTAHGAWQLFGDLTVEKDFIENFMLTDPDKMWHGFFPEVYPGSKKDDAEPGIANWSFWLLTELADYYERSGDEEFIAGCRERVTRFVEGMLELRGESGLLEGLKGQFVDWSLSNRSFCLEPVSVPNNCLAVCLLEKMAELYHVDAWKTAADEMREIIEQMDQTPGIFGGGGDGAAIKDGKLTRLECPTESGMALELWSGFHLKDAAYIKRFVETMGTCPKYRADPNIGKSNLFIGLMVRFDVLSRLGKIDTLVKELKDLYLPQIKAGAGTLFENYAAFSGCHGFNGASGAMITNHVLGLGQPLQKSRSICISPHPGQLCWARGSAQCADGPIFLNWSADHEEHVLDIILMLPEGWKAEYDFPFELSGWKIILNGEVIRRSEAV